MKFVKNLLKLVRDRLRATPEPVKRVTCEWCERPLGCCDCQDRIACPNAGAILHQMCGWCHACDVPMFQCVARHWERSTRR